MATQANTPNVRLREARESANLTLEQVADRVAHEVERATGKRPAIDADLVGRYERGLHTWPGRDYRAAFRVVFEAGSDAELGFYSQRARARLVQASRPTLAGRAGEGARVPKPALDPVDRRQFVFALGALGAEVAAGTRIGASEVTQLRGALVSFKTLDNQVGGDRLHESAAAHLRHVSRLINVGRFREATGRKLRSAFADLAVFTGWLSYDAGRHAEAWYYYQEGLTAARLAGDLEVEVHAFAQLSSLAGRTGRPRDAVELARQAQSLARDSAPRLVALLSMREAQGWSQLGERGATNRALRQSRRLFDHGPDERDPAWISFFDRAELDGLTAVCLEHLGDYERASELTAQTLAVIQPRYVRNRALYTAGYALELARAGRPDEAAAAGTQTLALLTDVSSARTRGELRGVHRHLVKRHGRLAAVREFDQQFRGSGIA